MITSGLVRLGALTLVAAVSPALRGGLRAQGAQLAQPQVQLAFGYECDDRFLLRNDGSQDVSVEYNIAGSADRSPLHLKGKESVEISSPSQSALELRVGGRVVSTANKGNRPCAQAPPEQAVIVRPIEPRDYVTYSQPVYIEPRVVYAEAVPVYYPPPVYYYYGQPALSVVVPFFTHFGGYERTVYVGRGGPGRRGRHR